MISIIIVNYNSGDKLTECITSIVNQASEVEIIVVDNASDDGSLSLLTSSFPDNQRLNILRNKTNMGFSVACNRGADIASGHYLLYLNPDCVIEKDTLPALVGSLKENQLAGMAGSLLLNPDGTEQVGGRRTIPTPWRTLVRVLNLSGFSKRYPRLFSDFNLHARPLPSHPLEVEAISGACMMVRRNALDDVGGLDENYFLHCEDLDWCMRFRQKGWKILFVPAARVTHYLGVCGKSRPVFVEWHKHKGMMRFYRKYFRHQYPGLLMWLVALGVWLRFGMLAIIKTAGRVLGKLAHGRG